MHYIAVYGSLKKGAYNHSRFELGEPITTGGIKGSMYLHGTYPRLYREEDSYDGTVLEHGVEIYSIDDNKYSVIDGMELGAGYMSKEVDIDADDGNVYTCTVYFSLPEEGNRQHYLEEYTADTVPVAFDLTD